VTETIEQHASRSVPTAIAAVVVAAAVLVAAWAPQVY